MLNTVELCKIIENKGCKKNQIACELGITADLLSKKLDGKKEFKVSEIQKLSNLLELEPRKLNAIFFTY